MSNLGKLIKKLKKNPVDVRFDVLRKLLEYDGYKLTHKKGSHFHFKKDNSPSLIVVTHNKKVKKWYVKDVLKELDLS